MKHTFYATKDIFPLGQSITKETKPLVTRGEVLLTIDTPVELDRAIAAISNGSATADKPETKPAAAARRTGSTDAPVSK